MTTFTTEQFEQLLEANERLTTLNSRLREQLSSAQAQLASLSSLTARLTEQQAATALVPFGEGPDKRWLSAKTIRVLWLQAQELPGQHGTKAQTGLFAVQVDELRVTDYLPRPAAERARDEVAAALNRVLVPPVRTA